MITSLAEVWRQPRYRQHEDDQKDKVNPQAGTPSIHDGARALADRDRKRLGRVVPAPMAERTSLDPTALRRPGRASGAATLPCATLQRTAAIALRSPRARSERWRRGRFHRTAARVESPISAAR